MANGSDISTQALVDDAISGSSEAFARLVDRYRDAASAVAYSYLGGFDDVQDAVQEAFVHAYCNLRQLREPAKFGPWLRKITANSCAMALRKRERANVSLEEIAEQPAIADDARRVAMREVVREALGKLSDATRLTVTLSYINGYSHAEVADFLEVPITAVRSRLRHAKRKLREEMIEMVSDVLHEDKPGEELVRQVLEIATRVHSAMMIGASAEALQRCDAALAAIHDLGDSRTPDQLKELLLHTIEAEGSFGGAYDKPRLLHCLDTMTLHEFQVQAEAEILVAKGQVLLQMEDLGGANQLFAQAMELAKSVDNREVWTVVIEKIAHHYHNFNQVALAKEYLPLIIEAARDAGNALKEAMNLWGLANMHLDDSELAAARPLYERARELFEQTGRPERAVMAQAALDLIGEAGDSWASVAQQMAFCVALKRTGGSTEFTDRGGGWASKYQAPWSPMGMMGLGKILDNDVPAGGSWPESGSWVTDGPQQVTHTVLGYDESVVTSRGEYSGCVLVERLTVENKLPDNMSDEVRARLRSNSGSIRKWYAPGVGLVRLVARNNDGYVATIDLESFETAEPSNDHLPLAIGNSWTYGWADAPEGCTEKQRYRVAANEGEHWYLESYRYVLKQAG